jgi:hypothetical protein
MAALMSGNVDGAMVNPPISLVEGLRPLHDDKNFAMKTLGKFTKVTGTKSLEESYRFRVDSFFKDFKTPVDGIRLMVEQLASSRMIDASLAQKTPLTAYYEHRYVEELEKEGFFKKLWQ